MSRQRPEYRCFAVMYNRSCCRQLSLLNDMDGGRDQTIRDDAVDQSSSCGRKRCANALQEPSWTTPDRSTQIVSYEELCLYSRRGEMTWVNAA
jgi:hypothetical protein